MGHGHRLAAPCQSPFLATMLPNLFNNSRVIGSLVCPLSTAAAAATVGAEQPSKPHFMVDYLIKSCGFSPAKASRAASKHLSHLKSTQKPDSFLGSMRSHGFDDAQLRRIVASDPRFLCSDVEKTLAPKFRSLQSIGFSASDLTSLVSSHPNLLHYRVDSAFLQSIKLWESLLGSRESLTKAFRPGSFWLLGCSVEERAVPNLTLLRKCGFSEERIAMLVRKAPRVMFMKPEKFSEMVEQMERMGIPRNSKMSIWGLHCLSMVSKARLDAKLKLMKSFGWSEADFLSVFRKAPNFLMLSPKLLSEKRDFLVKVVGLQPLQVVSKSALLIYSLDKRMVPRHRVIKILESRNLLDRKCELVSVAGYSDKVFREKYVTPYKNKVPELEEIIKNSGARDDAP